LKDNIIVSKTESFADRIVKVYKYLKAVKNEHRMSDQLLRSGTSIGALVKEAQFAQSTADFINKNYIALKEANEASYWIDRLHNGDYFTDAEFKSLSKDVNEIIAILISIVKSTKEKI
jgi:four helix bundle protein